MEFHLIIGQKININGLNIPKINQINDKIIIHDYTQEKINDLNFNIAEDSLVIIDAHGTTGTYNIDLFLDKHSIKQTLEKITNHKHLNLELFACLSGAAINMAPMPSTLITLSTKDHTSIEYLDNELIYKSISFTSPENPFIRFASYIFINPDQVQLSINIGKINKVFAQDFIEKLENYSISSLQKFQLALLESFLHFLTKIKTGLDTKYRKNIEQLEDMKLLENKVWLSQFDITRYRELLLLNMINLVKVDIVKKLLNAGVNINAQLSTGTSTIFIAAQGLSVTESLEQGNITKSKEFEVGYLEIIKTLINKNASIDEPNNTGDTALLASAQGGHLAALNILIKAGASLNKQNNSGDTALHIAALRGKTKTTESLIKAGASTTLQNKSGATALYLSTQDGHCDVAEKLIKTEQELVNLKIHNGRSPLHIAAQNGHIKIVEILLKNKAVINSLDCSGISPLDVAIYSYHELLDFFKKEVFSNNNIKYSDAVKNINLSNIKKDIKSSLLESLKFIRKEKNNLILADIATYIRNKNYIIKKLLDNEAKLQYFAMDSTAINQLLREGEIFSSNPIIYLLSYNSQSDFSKIHNFDSIDYNKTKVLF